MGNDLELMGLELAGAEEAMAVAIANNPVISEQALLAGVQKQYLAEKADLEAFFNEGDEA